MRLKTFTEKLIMLWKDPRLRQSSILLGSMVLAMGVNFITSIIVARQLGPESYGNVKFIQIIWSLLTLLFSFGFFHSGSRVLVIEKEPDSIREIIGAVLFISFLTGTSLSILTAILALPIDIFFHTQVANDMIQLSPLVLVMSVYTALTLILQGVNRIYLLAILNAVPVLLYLVCILVLSHFHLLTTVRVLLSNQTSFLVVILFGILRLRPSFKSMRYWWKLVRKHNKTYGGPVYLGSLANVASSYVNSLAISYWMDNASIGFYSLATSLTEPLKLIPNAVATSSFRSFASQKKIPTKVFVATLVFSLLAVSAALLFFGQPLSWVYTKDFAEVGTMARALAAGAILSGLGDFINRFLGAHGKGNALRNVAYLVGGVNVAGFFLLIPLWGVWGVISTSVLGGFAYLLFMYGYYRKHISVTNAGSGEEQATPANINSSSRQTSQSYTAKIVILLDSFGFPNGMAATRRVQLIARMLIANNFQVNVLCARALEKQPVVINENAKGVYEGISFEYTTGTTIRPNSFWARRYFDVKGIVIALTRLAVYRAKGQVDCIYYYGNILQNTLNRWIFYLAARMLRIPIITDISESPWTLTQQGNWSDRLLSPIKGVNGVILISKFLKDWVTEEAARKQRIIPVLYLPVLVDPNECCEVRTNGQESSMSVLFAGSDRNTIEFIIRAMEKVWLEYPQCKLIITGFETNKPQSFWLKQLSQQTSTQGKMILAGYLPRSELVELYHNASALLIPLFDDIGSRARFPTKIAEYLCSGTPIVTCRVGEGEQYLTDGVTAYMSEPDNVERYADKILEAISPQNWDKTREVGKRGQKVAIKFFDVSNYKDEIMDFFSSVCKHAETT